MFKQTIRILTATAFFAVSCVTAQAMMGMGQFSADMISQASGQTVQAKIYVGDKKMRMEMSQMTMITRLDKNVAWMLMPSQNMYMEHPIDPKVVAQTSKDLPGELERKPLGREDVSGESAEKFLVTYTQKGEATSIYQWIGDGNIPVKVADVNGQWSVEYRNIQAGPQPDSLFEVPAGYQKFAMPSMAEMMNGMGQ